MSLPQPYDRWLVELVGGPLPQEARATCHDCVMCGPEVHGGTFHPQTRCCTYVPRLPNYQVGRVLEDTDPTAAEGRAGVLRRLAGPGGISPLGIEVTEDIQALYDRIVAENGFGRTGELRCPHHLDDGRCGVWKYRNGICATWFCLHEDGALAQRFWDATQRLFTEVERAIGFYVARCVRYPEGVVDDRAADDALYAGDWGPWAGRPADFYRACARVFMSLSWTRVRQLGGNHLNRICDEVRSLYTARTAPLPARLWSNQAAWEGPVLGEKVYAYSSVDYVKVPQDVMDNIELFDGRRVTDVLTQMAELGVHVDPDLLRQLRAFEVLVPDAPTRDA